MDNKNVHDPMLIYPWSYKMDKTQRWTSKIPYELYNQQWKQDSTNFGENTGNRIVETLEKIVEELKLSNQKVRSEEEVVF